MVLSSISAAESGITPFYFLYLLVQFFRIKEDIAIMNYEPTVIDRREIIWNFEC